MFAGFIGNVDFWELLVQEWADGDLRNIVPPGQAAFLPIGGLKKVIEYTKEQGRMKQRELSELHTVNLCTYVAASNC